MWLSLSLYKVLITQVLDNTGDVNPVEVVVPVYALGIETKVVISLAPLVSPVVVRHRRPQPLRVGVIEAFDDQTQRTTVSGHASQNAKKKKNEKEEKALIGWSLTIL